MGWLRGVRMEAGGGCDLEVGDLPGAVGEALVDAGVAVGSLELLSVGGALDMGEGGDDGDVADELDFELGGIETGEDKLAVSHVVELLSFGEDFAGGGDAEVVVGEELVHGGDVVGEGGRLPLFLEFDDLFPLQMLALMVWMRRLRRDKHGRHPEESGEEQRCNSHWESADRWREHGCTGC